MNRIAERTDVTREQFDAEILAQGRPVVMRGLVRDWPAVHAALRSPEALRDYTLRFDSHRFIPTMIGPPAIGGRLFYNDDMDGLNCKRAEIALPAAFDYLIAHAADETPATFAIQSSSSDAMFPGFSAENLMPLLDTEVEPQIWIGNRTIVAPHGDPFDNIACVTAGRRRFTLFPPDQVANLYVGPFEMSPTGATISMVNVDAPDFDAHPRYAKALETALVAELEPGDAIFIPYLWWHHVRALEPLNMLVNDWWAPPAPGRGSPRDVLIHALLTLKDLPPNHREAWRALLGHYVFQDGAPSGAHLPPERRGILGQLDLDSVSRLRRELGASMLPRQPPPRA